MKCMHSLLGHVANLHNLSFALQANQSSRDNALSRVFFVSFLTLPIKPPPIHYSSCTPQKFLHFFFLQEEEELVMESSKVSAILFIFMLFISSTTPILGCRSCGKSPSPKHKHPPKKKGPIPLPPVHLPPLPVPIPPVTLPPVPKIPIPPVTNPPSKGKPCPAAPPPKKDTCPIDTLKLGACVDLLGGLVPIGVGDPVVNQCCPVLKGLAELEAAVCLCTTLKVKALNLSIYVPIALQLLITCGKTPPPGYTCVL